MVHIPISEAANYEYHIAWFGPPHRGGADQAVQWYNTLHRRNSYGYAIAVACAPAVAMSHICRKSYAQEITEHSISLSHGSTGFLRIRPPDQGSSDLSPEPLVIVPLTQLPPEPADIQILELLQILP